MDTPTEFTENSIEGSLSDASVSHLQTAFTIKALGKKEGFLESPIDINISKTISIEAPLLKWYNFENPPKKMKITNSGHTIIVSGKWRQERPYITSGPLLGKYYFSQMHFHWGASNMEGSEHTIDGGHYPGEVHVVMYNSNYESQEAASKQTDGVVVLAFLLKLQDGDNTNLDEILKSVPEIQNVNETIRINPICINQLVTIFSSDYFAYWGSINTKFCIHNILWFISRIPLGISVEQMDSLRCLFNEEGTRLLRNFRPTQPLEDRHVFLINPSSSQYSTLLFPFRGGIYVYRLDKLYKNPMNFKKYWKRRNHTEK